MTAIIVFRRPDAVHIFSDGGMDLPRSFESKQVFHGPKCWALPHLNAAMAARGPQAIVSALASILGSAAVSFDELRNSVPSLVKKYFEENLCGIQESPHGAGFDVVIGGWSETKGADLFAVSTRIESGHEPWALIDIPKYMISPSTPELLASVNEQISKADESVDPVSDALAIMDQQRRLTMDGAPKIFVQHTIIRKSHVEMRIARRWPESERVIPLTPNSIFIK